MMELSRLCISIGLRGVVAVPKFWGGVLKLLQCQVALAREEFSSVSHEDRPEVPSFPFALCVLIMLKSENHVQVCIPEGASG